MQLVYELSKQSTSPKARFLPSAQWMTAIITDTEFRARIGVRQVRYESQAQN